METAIVCGLDLTRAGSKRASQLCVALAIPCDKLLLTGCRLVS